MAKINKEKQAAMPQKLLHELFEYDRLTGGWINKTTRAPNTREGHPAGSVDKTTGYVRIWINANLYYAHRLAWTYVHGDYPNGEQPWIDHINGKKDDNRIENLRVNSHSENMRNTKMMSNNTSGTTGVSRREKVRPSGKICVIWVTTWRDELGKQRMKTFNIQKLGEDVAKQTAIDYRAKQIRLLELDHGIVYSERHGT